MKISIITAVYNNITHIEDAILSVLNQSYKNIEYIVIDGASTDGTKELIEKYNDRISIIISEPDSGIYDALNKGIQHATGSYIGFLHSDDLFATSTIIEEIVSEIAVSQCDGIYGNLLYIDKKDTTKIIRTWKSKVFNRKNLYFGWMPAHPTLFLNSSIYKNHGWFDTSFTIAADYDFMTRILLDKTLTFHYFSKTVTKMRTGGASNKFSHLILKSMEDLKAIKKNNLIIVPLFTLLCKNFRKVGQFLN